MVTKAIQSQVQRKLEFLFTEYY